MATDTRAATEVRQAKMIIGGEQVDAADGQTFDVINPATGNRGAFVVLGEGPGRNGEENFAKTYYKQFGPRFGFAYAASPKTVFRSGFAIFTVAPIRQSTEGQYGFFPSQNRFIQFLPQDRRTSFYTPTVGGFLEGSAMYDKKGKLITPDGPGSEQDRVFDGVRFFQE